MFNRAAEDVTGGDVEERESLIGGFAGRLPAEGGAGAHGAA